MSDLDDEQLCEDPDVNERDSFGELPKLNVVFHQEKDIGWVFFRINQEKPPIFHIVYTPDVDAHKDYASENGLRSFHPVDKHWSILVPLPTDDLEDEQWDNQLPRTLHRPPRESATEVE